MISVSAHQSLVKKAVAEAMENVDVHGILNQWRPWSVRAGRDWNGKWSTGWWLDETGYGGGEWKWYSGR